MSQPQQSPQPPRRARASAPEPIRTVRELWLLRERSRVRAAERRFLLHLERLLGRRAYSSPPPPLSHVSFVDSVSAVPPMPPPPIPPPPMPPPVSARTRSAPLARSVFENDPPPRGDTAPVRERRDAAIDGIELLRARQPVTNLSAQFRARLEGNDPTPPITTIVRSRSFGQLARRRAVSAMLESEFRHHLEGLMSRRDAPPHTQPPLQPHLDLETPITHPSHSELTTLVRALQQEVTVLKNVMSASFDLQLDIQRAIRQEVCAAMANSSVKQVSESSSCAVQAASARSASTRSVSTRAAKAGVCTVCLENPVDCVLYACGHMCTCSLCARQLLSTGQKCPICRAPVRDVVRAFIVTETAAS